MERLPPEDYRAFREGAAVLDRSGARARIAVTGADRLSYLNAMLTNDVAGLAPGTGRYAAYLTPQGRMIADMRVLELGDLALVDLDTSVADAVRAKLEQFVFAEDVQFSDLSASLGAPAVFGPRASAIIAAVLEGVTAETLSALPEHHSARAAYLGHAVVVASTRELGVAGFDLYVDRAQAAPLIASAVAAGARQAGEAAAETVRIEAGRPRFGADMDEHTIPLEAGLEERAISYTKGCFPGQEVIVRVRDRGHGKVARKLVGLTFEREEVPASGDPVTVNGKEMGRVTSAAFSPATGAAIALAYVARDYANSGQAVTVSRGGEAMEARVSDLPFGAAS